MSIQGLLLDPYDLGDLRHGEAVVESKRQDQLILRGQVSLDGRERGQDALRLRLTLARREHRLRRHAGIRDIGEHAIWFETSKGTHWKARGQAFEIRTGER